MTSYTDVVKGQAFKHLDTTKSIAIRFVDQNGNYAYPNSDHKWTAKIAIESGQKPGYIGDYPVYPDGGSLIVQSKDLVKLAPGEYRLEAWETYTDSDGNEETAIWPTPASSIGFTIEPNITDQTGEMVNQITFQDVVDSAVIAAGQNIVVTATNTLPAGSQASVTQKYEDGKNKFTFNIPQGLKGDKGDQGIQGPQGIQGLPGKDGKTPVRGVDYWTDADQKAIQTEGQKYIDSTLAKMNLEPEAFENEAALKAKYPSGNPGIMVTVDTGHKWIWADNTWKDCGVYQAAGVTAYGLKQSSFTGEPLPSPYNDLNTLPNNTIVSYAPLKSLKNNPLSEAIIVKTEGPTDVATSKNYSKVQTLIGQWSGKKYYRTIWIGDDGTGNWSDWHSSYGMQQISFSSEPLPSPYDDLNTLPDNKIIFYAPLKSLKNNPVSEPIIVKTEGPNIPTSKNYGEIQTLIGQWSYKEYHRIRWVGDDGTGNWGDWHSESVTQEANKTDLNEVSLSIFDKVAVIGDSYSAGWLLKPDGSSFYDKSKYQWPRLLGKKYGFAVNNLSMSGWTAQDFVNSKLNDIAVAGPQDAYIIALGINDQSNGKETLGSKDDLKEDYQSNPDSFYGNMGKIIGTIKANDINARIILLTIMRNDGAVTTTFDSAIKEIAGHYGLPVADITSDPYFQTDTYNQRKAGGHPTIVGYGALAEHLDTVLQNAILNNYDYFCNTASIFDDTVK